MTEFLKIAGKGRFEIAKPNNDGQVKRDEFNNPITMIGIEAKHTPITIVSSNVALDDDKNCPNKINGEHKEGIECRFHRFSYRNARDGENVTANRKS